MESTGPSQPIEWQNLSGRRLRADIEIGPLNGCKVRSDIHNAKMLRSWGNVCFREAAVQHRDDRLMAGTVRK